MGNDVSIAVLGGLFFGLVFGLLVMLSGAWVSQAVRELAVAIDRHSSHISVDIDLAAEKVADAVELDEDDDDDDYCGDCDLCGGCDKCDDEDHGDDLGDLEMAWGVIANVSGGNWKLQSDDWQKAAADFRERWNARLHLRSACCRPSPAGCYF